jgi:hypothetical protein
MLFVLARGASIFVGTDEQLDVANLPQVKESENAELLEPIFLFTFQWVGNSLRSIGNGIESRVKTAATGDSLTSRNL